MRTKNFISIVGCLMLIYSQITAQSIPNDSICESKLYIKIFNQFKLLKHDNASFPIGDLETEKIRFIVPDKIKAWKDYIYRYKTVPVFSYEALHKSSKDRQKQFDHQIFVIDDQVDYSALKQVIPNSKLSLVIFRDTIDTDLTALMEMADNVLHCPTNNYISYDLSVQLVFDALSLDQEPAFYDVNKRLKYLPPRLLGLDSESIYKQVDSIVYVAISEGAFPGCRVLVAHKGAVIFNESYGHHTYKKRTAVQQHDVYDLASVTKIAGPLPLIMQACDEGNMELDQPFSNYWKDWQKRLFHRSDKDKMTLREVLAHQARLTPYINYYPMTMKDGQYLKKYYRLNPSEKYSLPIDRHLYLSTEFKKEIYKAIRRSPLLNEAKYKYSGLSYIIYPQLLSDLFNDEYETILYRNFYERLGASSLCYRPLDKIETDRIVPTEYDSLYRKHQIKGWVHDEAAAVMGGVSGNAGLFASADDLAKLMQMYLQKGSYAGIRYISEETFNEFTKVQYPDNDNRRGAGFDKPLFGNDTLSIADSYPAPGVSAQSFGHSGFTGTFVWVDPAYDIIYIFLSNRVYPTRDNPLIYRMNVRPSIQQVFYEEVKKSEIEKREFQK
ncbi:MAG: beta-lactamase family protein [Carboxylicivirga sp.]|jgi:CubicO group peptidase (beta-lactamase class C family)|nr:beta-lactamase family protein [Carboxylicivirga sp.]